MELIRIPYQAVKLTVNGEAYEGHGQAELYHSELRSTWTGSAEVGTSKIARTLARADQVTIEFEDGRSGVIVVGGHVGGDTTFAFRGSGLINNL